MRPPTTSRTPVPSRSKFRPDIEGLRGIAVLSVVAYHCGIPGLPGGFAGVDVFFVLSGYLITGLLLKEVEATGKLSLLEFYGRRVRRLLPACALVVLVTLIASAILLAPLEIRDAGHAARATAVYLSNMFFAINASDYFAPDMKLNPVLHTWSLGVEEQFYLFWPILLMFALQFGRSKKLLVGLLLTLTAVSLAASIRLTVTSPQFAFYGMHTRVWEFGIGGLAVLLPRRPERLGAIGWNAIGWTALSLILLSFHFISSSYGFPGWIAVVPVVGTAVALVVGAEQPHTGISFMLDSPPLQFLGTMSYSWYLWHWPSLVIAAAYWPMMPVQIRIAVAIGSLLLAVIAHKFVENPVRFHPLLVKSAWLSLGVGAALMVVSLAASLVAIRYGNQLASSPAMEPLTKTRLDLSDLPRWECVSFPEDTGVKVCSFGDTKSSTTIVLFGDSHAAQWFDPVRDLAVQYNWKLVTVLKSGCPATDIPGGVGCSQWREESFKRIEGIKPDVVLVANASAYLFDKQPFAQMPVLTEEWGRATNRTLTKLSASAGQVLQIRDNPHSPFNVAICLGRLLRHSWYPASSCDIPKSMAFIPGMYEAEKNGIAGLSNVGFIDLTEKFCDGQVCQAMRDGIIVYRDDNHITSTYASKLTPVLESHLVRAVKEKAITATK